MSANLSVFKSLLPFIATALLSISCSQTSSQGNSETNATGSLTSAEKEAGAVRIQGSFVYGNFKDSVRGLCLKFSKQEGREACCVRDFGGQSRWDRAFLRDLVYADLEGFKPDEGCQAQNNSTNDHRQSDKIPNKGWPSFEELQKVRHSLKTIENESRMLLRFSTRMLGLDGVKNTSVKVASTSVKMGTILETHLDTGASLNGFCDHLELLPKQLSDLRGHLRNARDGRRQNLQRA